MHYGMVVFWIAGLILFIAVVMFFMSAAGALSRNNDSPQAILQRRYAAGEIDTDEYERRIAELRKTRRAA
jgi:putative membrane protein